MGNLQGAELAKAMEGMQTCIAMGIDGDMGPNGLENATYSRPLASEALGAAGLNLQEKAAPSTDFGNNGQSFDFS